MMPVMDGISLLTELRANPSYANTPVIMLSARDGIQEELRELGISADAHMAKPFSARKLSRLARTLILERAERRYAS